jgi:hypothetical protein
VRYARRAHWTAHRQQPTSGAAGARLLRYNRPAFPEFKPFWSSSHGNRRQADRRRTGR